MTRPNEKLLIYGLIAYPEVAVASGLQPQDFSEPQVRAGFERLLARLAAGETVSPATCGLVGGENRLTSAETAVLARDLWGLAVARRISAEAESLLERGVTGDAFLDALGAAVDRVGRGGGSTPRVGEIAEQRANELLLDRSKSRVRTGLPGLDDRIGGGLLRGVPCVIGARPGVGKSSLGLAITKSVVKSGGQAIVFSLEDSWRQYVDRVFSQDSGIPASQLERGGRDFRPTAARLPKGWWLDDTAGLSSRALTRRARLIAHRAGGVDLVVVDYIQLLRPEKAAKNDHEAIKDAMADLAKLARDLDCPVLVLSQLNRSSETEGREPNLADLRASGSIEEVAKMVMLCHRPGFGTEVDDQMVVNVLKNSFGGAGKVLLGWDGPLTRVFQHPLGG